MGRILPGAALLGALLGLGCSADGGSADLELAREPAGLGEMCGGIAGIPCAGQLWCDPDPGTCRGADFSGTCVGVSPICTRDYRPVCGCDGRTYGNDCERRAARARRDHDGECGR